MDFMKEWGMKLAANEERHARQQQEEQARMTRQSNGAGVALNTTAQSTAPAAPKAAASMAAPAKKENGQAANTAEAPNPMQVVRLLHDLGDRLRRSEAEREALWRELERTQKFLTEIQDHSTKAEKAFLSLESQISRREKLTQDILERQAKIETVQAAQADQLNTSQEEQKKIAGRVDNIETTAGSALVRIEDALNESSKLSRRMELVSQDKARLLRKIEAMEETLTLTQDTLKAKALVLLTDQVIASRTALPQREAITEADTTRIATSVQAAQASHAAAPVMPAAGFFGGEQKWVWKRSWTTTALVLAPVVVLALVAGWGISRMGQSDMPPITVMEDGKVAQYNQDKKTWEPIAETAATKTAGTDISDLEALAKQAEIDPSVLNDIEPGALTEETAASPAESVALDDPALIAEYNNAKADEQKALAEFTATKDKTPVADRIKPDMGLPAIVKDVEAKALEGNAEAQHDLAAIYTAGHANVKANYARAATWFREAALNGIANAQYNLGVLNHQGLGVKQNTAEAIMLYRVAAGKNHPEAQYNLGIAHIEGVGAEYNPQRAAAYFEQAARGGIVEAAYNLGLVHENGLLGEARPEEALFWYQLAAEEGNPQAREALTQLTKQMDLSADAAAKIFDKISGSKPGLVDAMKKAQSSAATPAAVKPHQKAEAAPEQDTDAVAAEAAPTDITAAVKPAEDMPVVKPLKPAKKAVDTSTAAKPAKPAKVASLYDPVIVAQIQEQLVRMGLYPGPADGEATPQTEDAVRSYQSSNDLKVDGHPTEDVLVHMLAREMDLGGAAQKSSAADEDSSLNN